MKEKAGLKDLERYLSDGQEPWSLKMRALAFGPFEGEEMPTTFFMDVEYDPVFAQFCGDGFVYVFNDQGAGWTAFSADQLQQLAAMSEDGAAMAQAAGQADEQNENET